MQTEYDALKKQADISQKLTESETAKLEAYDKLFKSETKEEIETTDEATKPEEKNSEEETKQ
jgi:hypothetical protein